MTDGERVAYNNGFIIGCTSKGIIKGDTTRTYMAFPIMPTEELDIVATDIVLDAVPTVYDVISE